MLYSGPGFLGSSHAPSRQQVNYLSQSSCVSLVELTDRGGGGEKGGEEAKSYDHQKASRSNNHSIFSEQDVERSGDGVA